MDGESREERDARIRALWEQLDTKRKGNVDLPALKNGLTKMNHRECARHSRARGRANAKFPHSAQGCGPFDKRYPTRGRYQSGRQNLFRGSVLCYSTETEKRSVS